jgi:acetyltransferase-like isoleucine patch superfamily enzyme
MSLSKMVQVLYNEIHAIYAFWVFKLVDLLGYGSIANRLRCVFLRLAGFDIGTGCLIRPGLTIHSLKAGVKIGKGVGINKNVYFDGPAIIGNHVDIGHGSKFVSSSHPLVSNFQTLRSSFILGPVIIEDFVWLGCNVLVLGGVTVGRGSVVGAGSVVTKSIPPNSLAVGIPAKVIRSLEEKDRKDEN